LPRPAGPPITGASNRSLFSPMMITGGRAAVGPRATGNRGTRTRGPVPVTRPGVTVTFELESGPAALKWSRISARERREIWPYDPQILPTWPPGRRINFKLNVYRHVCTMSKSVQRKSLCYRTYIMIMMVQTWYRHVTVHRFQDVIPYQNPDENVAWSAK
jgi:hypothetical protein